MIRYFNEQADFDATFRWLEKRLSATGCVWGVIPKKSALRAGQKDLKTDMVKAAKRQMLIEGKAVPFSQVEQGIRLSRKKK